MATQLLKSKLPTSKCRSSTKTPYSIYLESLSPTGRNSIKTLLHQCASILGYQKSIEYFDWSKLTYEKVHMVRTAFTEAGYAVNSINLAVAGLKGVAKTAFNLGQINADTLMRINSVRSLKGTAMRTGRRLSKAEIIKLLAGCQESPFPAVKSRDRAILLVGIGVGLRCSEICALNLGDIDFQNGVLVVREGKGRKQRQIYPADEILKSLNDWITFRNGTSRALFSKISKNGDVADSGLSPSGLNHILSSLQQMTGVERFTPHDLRRTFITQLLEKGVDLNTVRQLAGHSDVSTTVRYDKRGVEWQKVASQSFDFR